MPYQFHIADLIRCAEREAAMRRNVYPRRVADGRMSKELADRETALMEAIVEQLKALDPNGKGPKLL